MYMKRYTIAATILIAIVGWYVYAFVTHESMSIELFGVNLPSLSIAVWVIIPLVILYIASLAHMTFYSILGSFELRKYEKDYEKILDSIVDAFLAKKERNHSFKTERYRVLGSMIDNTNFIPHAGLISKDVKISKVLEALDGIKKGEVVDLKPYSLKFDNELVVQNNRNRYKNGDVSAEDILTHSSNYTKEFSQEIYADFVKTSPLYAIEQYKEFMTKSTLYEVLNRVNADEYTLEISNEALIQLFSSLELNMKDYIDISISLPMGMIPEQRIKLFEIISETNDVAMDAYLFTLYDLEMLFVAAEILDISQTNEYMNFKAYRALRECNKNFNINLFI